MSVLWDLTVNIMILSVLANFICRLKVVQGLLLERTGNIYKKIILAFMLGLICIYSTSSGVHLDNVIVNTRVIGALAAGILGGPFVGTLTGIIAGVHRYYYDIHGFTAVACSLSTFIAGLLGAFISPYFLKGDWKLGQLAAFTAVAEVIHMILILLISRPFSIAVATVQTIAIPMILVNSIGMVVFISSIRDNFDSKDLASEAKVRSGLSLAERCLPYFRKGLSNTENMNDATTEILSATFFNTVMIMDKNKMIAKQQEGIVLEQGEDEEFLKIAQQAMEEAKTITVSSVASKSPLGDIVKQYNIYASPLFQWEQPVGCLLVLIHRNWLSQESDRSMVQGLTSLLSTQLELYEVDRQKRLRKKAEYSALQSQIIPHFLYNTLNTLACICREDASRARELLFTMATYYRQTIDSNSYLICLEQELQQVKNYLVLEKARFEEKLSVDFQVSESDAYMVPPLILQPLVENAVKYGVDKKGNRRICINAAQAESAFVISVMDHGPGFTPEALNEFMNEELSTEKRTEASRSHIGLINVRKRLRSIFGDEGQMYIQRVNGVTGVHISIPLYNNRNEKEGIRA